MNYVVIVQPGAQRQLNDNAAWWATHRDAEQAARWLKGFQDALESLAKNPQL